MAGLTTFYLGTDQPGWLARMPVPLFVSRRRLLAYRTMPRAFHAWALDSGGFSELTLYGEWRTPTDEFVAQVRRIRDEVGLLRWAAPQDWMCEPSMLARTGLTVGEHLRRTLGNFLALRERAGDVPWVPVLQGWALEDYLRHADAYEAAGIRLRDEPTVAVGTLCRRHATREAEAILRCLAGLGLRLHGFGVKTQGLVAAADVLSSADSMAWSYRARRHGAPMLAGCAHRTCSHCPRFALSWHRRMCARLREQHQTALAL